MKLLVFSALFFGSLASAAPLTCVAAGTPTAIRTEGLTERVGDIILNCSGGVPGSVAGGNLAIFLPAPVTNRLSAANSLDVVLNIDSGAGEVPSGIPAGLQGTAGVVFNGFQVTIPPSGAVSLRIRNIRINASSLMQANPQPVFRLYRHHRRCDHAG